MSRNLVLIAFQRRGFRISSQQLKSKQTGTYDAILQNYLVNLRAPIAEPKVLDLMMAIPGTNKRHLDLIDSALMEIAKLCEAGRIRTFGEHKKTSSHPRS